MHNLVPLFLSAVTPAHGGGRLEAKLIAPDADASDELGRGLAIDGDTIVGAAWLDDDAGMEGGAVYVWRDLGGVWTAVQKLVPLDAGGWFGADLGLDGDTLVVSSFLGHAHVYERDLGGPDAWGLSATLLPTSPSTVNFGDEVAVSGSTIAVSAPYTGEKRGTVHIFERDLGGPDAWGEQQVLWAPRAQPGDEFGVDVAIDGDTLVVGTQSVDDPRIVFFERDAAGTWRPTVERTAPNVQGAWGTTVALDGDHAVAGISPVWILGRDVGGPGNWGEEAVLVDPTEDVDFWGDRVAVGGDLVAVSAPAVWGAEGGGSVWVYRRNDLGQWPLAARLMDPDGYWENILGRTVAVDGGLVVAGANGDPEGGAHAGALFVYGPQRLELMVDAVAPSQLTVSLVGASGLGPVGLLTGDGPGREVVPRGPCVGTRVGLDAPSTVLTGQASTAGTGRTDPLDAGELGTWLQAVDQLTCETSEIVEIPR